MARSEAAGTRRRLNVETPGASFARLDKLKHVPQSAARKLSAVSFQLLSGMKSSLRAKNMEG